MKAPKEQRTKQRDKEQTNLIAETTERKRENDHRMHKPTTKHDSICKIQDRKYGAASKDVRRTTFESIRGKEGTHG